MQQNGRMCIGVQSGVTALGGCVSAQDCEKWLDSLSSVLLCTAEKARTTTKMVTLIVIYSLCSSSLLIINKVQWGLCHMHLVLLRS